MIAASPCISVASHSITGRHGARCHRLVPNIRYRCSQLLSTLATVERGAAITLVAEGALPEVLGPGLQKIPLRPLFKRTVGLAVLDRREASPAAQAFIKMAVNSRQN